MTRKCTREYSISKPTARVVDGPGDYLDPYSDGSVPIGPSFFVYVASSLVSCIAASAFPFFAIRIGAEMSVWNAAAISVVFNAAVTLPIVKDILRVLARRRETTYHTSLFKVWVNESGRVSTLVAGSEMKYGIEAPSANPDVVMSHFIRSVDESGVLDGLSLRDVEFDRVPSDQTGSEPGVACTLIGRCGSAFLLLVCSNNVVESNKIAFIVGRHCGDSEFISKEGGL